MSAIEITTPKKNDSDDDFEAAMRRHWSRDKARIKTLIAASGVPGLTASFDDVERTIGLSAPGKSAGGLYSDAEVAITEWPGSKILGWTSENGPIVAVGDDPNLGVPLDLDSGRVGSLHVRDRLHPESWTVAEVAPS